MCEWVSPLEWSSRPPYMVNMLRLPFEVGGPSRGRLQVRKVIFRDYRVNLVICGPTGGAVLRPRGETCATSLAGLSGSG
jgi:hypothetical protein